MLEIKDAIADPAELDRMYPQPASPSIRKVTLNLTRAYRSMIEASPFVAVATCGVDGLDCSPRGDSAGFVRVADERTLLLPERRGNNRIDSLRNLVADPRIALLFMVPGMQETLRVNGRAVVSRNPELCESFAVKENARGLSLLFASRAFTSNAVAQFYAVSYGTRRYFATRPTCRRRVQCSQRRPQAKKGGRRTTPLCRNECKRRSTESPRICRLGCLEVK